MRLGDGNEAVRSLGAPKVGSRSQSSHGNDKHSFNEPSRKKGLEECLPVQQVRLLFSTSSRFVLVNEKYFFKNLHSLAHSIFDLNASHHHTTPNPVPSFVDAFKSEPTCLDPSLIQVAGS
jgi:hypothetical protein